jgi:hypothetical protein
MKKRIAYLGISIEKNLYTQIGIAKKGCLRGDISYMGMMIGIIVDKKIIINQKI